MPIPQTLCCTCSDDICPQRAQLGYKLCMSCGEVVAKRKRHIVQIPFNKGAYQYIHNPDDLKIVNPKPR
jgi:hypothetical protein